LTKRLKNPDNYNSFRYLDSFWKKNIPIIKNLPVQEAYQFRYSESFCELNYIITITKNNDTIKLNSFIFRPTEIVNEELTGVKILQNKNKNLTLENWETLIDSLDFADYWNLKPANYDVVLDPSHLVILGIRDNFYTVGEKRQVQSVSRTIFRRKAIYKAF